MAIKKKDKPEILSEEVFENDMAELDDLFNSEPEEEGPEEKAAPAGPSVSDTAKEPVSEEPASEPATEAKPVTPAEAPAPAAPTRCPGKITKKYAGNVVEEILDNMVKAKLAGDAIPEEKALPGGGFCLINRKTGEVSPIGGSVTIGADPSFASFRISGNNTVSRRHAEMMAQDGKVYVKDVGSRNGTYVNGVKIPDGQFIEAISGDTITFSNEEFILEGGEDVQNMQEA